MKLEKVEKYKKFEFVLLIPVFHNEDKIEQLKLEIQKYLVNESYFICFVDDSSNEETHIQIKKSFDSNFFVLRRKKVENFSTRYSASLEKVSTVVNARPGEIIFGLNLVVNRGKTVLIADTAVNEWPNSEQLANIAISSSRIAKLFGMDPKVAFLSHSTFGQPTTERTLKVKEAVEILDKKNVDFKYDGEMQPDVALEEIFKELYPFSEIVGNANILIMPGQHSAAISYKMMKTLGDTKVIGPLLIGLGLPIEIAPLRSSTSEILNLASIAAYSSQVIDY